MRRLAAVCVLLLAHCAWGAENAPEGLRGGLGVADWLVVSAYACGMLGIGLYYSYRTKTAEQYYLGDRKMKPGMVGLSLFASMISTISYLAVPGEIMRHGPMYLTSVAAIPFIYVIVGYLLVPHIMRLQITSAYELLEIRLGKGIRLLGCLIFLFIRFIWMGLVIFTAANVIAKAVGIGPAYIPWISISIGMVTVVYSSMGGIRAVVLTDAIQALILFFGAVVAILLISVKMGGFSWFPTAWAPNWDSQPFISLDPRVRVTVVGSMAVNIVWWVCTAGSDQMAIQRYLATRDAKSARRAFLINNTADLCTTVVLALLGFALLGFFTANPQYLSADLNLGKNADMLFPHFIVNFIGFGVAGLVFSGMLASAMSALSSGINATCTVINTDLIGYLLGVRSSDAQKVRTARITSFAIGVTVILLSLGVARVQGNLIEMTSKTSNLLVGPLFGLFFFAMFVPFATPIGAAFGSLYGFLAAFVISFSDLAGLPQLSWQWILPIAVAVNIVVGALCSLVPTRGKSLAFQAACSAVLAGPFVVAAVLFVASALSR